MDKALCMSKAARIPEDLWDTAVTTANHLRNLSPTTSSKTKTPHERLWGYKPNIEYLRTFGCQVYYGIASQQRHGKQAAKAAHGVLIGYPHNKKGYLIEDPYTRCVIEARDVTFDEHTFPYASFTVEKNNSAGASSYGELDDDRSPNYGGLEDYMNLPSVQIVHSPQLSTGGAGTADELTVRFNDEVETIDDNLQSSSTRDVEFPYSTDTLGRAENQPHGDSVQSSSVQLTPSGSEVMNRRQHNADDRPLPTTRAYIDPDDRPLVPASRKKLGYEWQEIEQEAVKDITAGPRNPKRQSTYRVRNAYMHDIKIPTTLAGARASKEWPQWVDAIKTEFESFQSKVVLTLTDLPRGHKPVSCKLVFDIKTDEKGNLIKYKARWTARGFSQVQGVTYDETTSPVVKLNSVKVLLAEAVRIDMEIEQMDVKTAFLNSTLNEEIYMTQLKGMVDEDNPRKVWRLNRAVYGLKQSSREWFLNISATIISMGIKRAGADECIFVRDVEDPAKKFNIALYVDDMLLMCKDMSEIDKVKKVFFEAYEMKDLGKVKQFLNIAMQRNCRENTLLLSQQKLILEILDVAGMTHSRPAHSAFDINHPLSKEMCPKNDGVVKKCWISLIE